MEPFDGSVSRGAENLNHNDQALKEHLSCLRELCDDGGGSATVQDVLHEVQSLERWQHDRSRFRRIARYLTPLIDFLMMYSPALDIIVQYDVNPSAIVWGSLKSLLKASMHTIPPNCQNADVSNAGPFERCAILQIHRACIGQARGHSFNFGQVRKNV